MAVTTVWFQVADVIAYKIYHNGDLPRYVSGLPLCLFQYLELNPEEVFISRVRQHQKEVGVIELLQKLENDVEASSHSYLRP